MMPTRPGRLAVRAYYRVGPRLARPISRSPRLRRLLRAGLEPLRRSFERSLR